MKIIKRMQIQQRRNTQICFKTGINTSFWERNSPFQQAPQLNFPLFFPVICARHPLHNQRNVLGIPRFLLFLTINKNR
ncbi:hypothetical protein A4R26_18090 [Niastella populi]|uniref:Uncharacterized protein n=1 Tax=Niastella populi TaxID=550983 RepID=A0A1V9FV57_9BACT|nr:hypothetical protein A4R26_18090 [Niastella populi]